MKYAKKEDLVLNNINDTDSYKLSHFLLYPEDMEYMESYFESRGGEFDECTLFGMQYINHKYLSKPITLQDVLEMEVDAVAKVILGDSVKRSHYKLSTTNWHKNNPNRFYGNSRRY